MSSVNFEVIENNSGGAFVSLQEGFLNKEGCNTWS